MLKRVLGFRRKSSDESRQSRFLRATSQSPSSSPDTSPSPSRLSVPIHGDDVDSTKSLRQPSPSGSIRTANTHTRKNSGPNPGPLGLNIIHTPKNGHEVDIVFIHGLGGASQRTWCKNEDPELFWPLKFLPFEPEICLTRIFTFGYDANLRGAGNVSTSVLDFAKDLLFDLKYAKDERKGDLNIGNVPLIFVVHSMGGLIVKEAYMQGQNDPEYESIIRAISAITFLATPHRGTNLAELLDRILRSTIITNSKLYITELAKNSFTLQKLNEQFRHIAPKLDIVSFYETQSTAIGLKRARVMILEKDSSVLGYPGETSKALNADHHSVCKYDSPSDPNYITVRNALQSLVSKIIAKAKSNRRPSSTRRESQDLRCLLAITELPDVDYIFFRDQWVPGTSEWILKQKLYLEWVQVRDSAPRLLWLHGGAGTGKSVLSSFIINNLVEQGCLCQYFFIRFGDHRKRTLSFILRSIAYQMARSAPGFSHRILQLMEEAIDFGTADPRTIWERIFKSNAFNMHDLGPSYWVIDGLDEAEDPRAIVRLLSEISHSSKVIRVLLVSRKTSEIADAFQKVSRPLDIGSLSVEGCSQDLSFYVHQELRMSGTAAYRENIVRRVVDGANENFLVALQQMPLGMEAIYDRMALAIARDLSSTDRALASRILQCVTSSLQLLTITELSQAMHQDMSQVLNFQRSIIDLCGGFVVIDNGENVALVHQTAREYLLSGTDRPFRVDKGVANKLMLFSCMRCLMAIGLRAKVTANRRPEFTDYAADSWSSHLIQIPLDRGEILDIILKFLNGPWVLTWIQVLAKRDQLGVLVKASKHLSRFSAKQNALDAAELEENHNILKQEIIASWAEDLMRIVGKFGTILRRNSESIYKLIPSFCPKTSAIYQQVMKMNDRSLFVSGLSNEKWDDSLARMSFGFGTYASMISAAGSCIAVLMSSGLVILYESTTFEEKAVSPLGHGERVYRMEMNNAGTLLATYGYITTKIWEVSTGKCKLKVENIESRPRPLTMLLMHNDTMLLVGSDDRRVRSLSLTQAAPSWQLVAELEEPELEGHFLNSSNHMALSKDSKLIAVAYRGHPLSAWETDGPLHIGHCWRKRNEVARGEVIQAMWHPQKLEVLGLYIEGVVFKWSPYDGEVDEIATGASSLAISSDGNLFATGDVRGTVKVYTTLGFVLLYQLVSADTVVGLAFSPDLRRFYDIRGSYGNAWEPNALLKFTEQRGKDSKSGSESESLAHASMASESWTGRIDSITVLAQSPSGRVYSCGTETGTVRLYDIQQGKLADLYVSRAFLSIEQMSWSSNGQLLCFSDSSKRVMIMSIHADADDPALLVEIQAEIAMKSSTNGPISQLLFHEASSKLLVRSLSMMSIVSLDSFEVTHSIDLHTNQSKWIIHPNEPDLIVAVGPRAIDVLNWNLVQIQTHALEIPRAVNATSDHENFSNEAIVDIVLVTHDKKDLFVQLSNQSRKDKSFIFIETSSISSSKMPGHDAGPAKNAATITPSALPHTLSSQISCPLAFLSSHNLIFLSKSFDVCSQHVSPVSHPSSPTSIPKLGPSQERLGISQVSVPNHRRLKDKNSVLGDECKLHFSLPGDWISKDRLALCSIWGVEKSFLCPRNGDVAVVRCATLV
ncbi:hypothetical protein ACLMJK_006237 [Lecanora helva]